ncbi:MAG: right-handed parallel beta-helix repeat-containing protein [Planctomycetes bacterium]|nr:right-handed parallel beta-helix repeat-containing protein [Planctomycetota bacterium]
MNTRLCIGLAVGIVVSTGPSVRAQCCEGGGGPTELGGPIVLNTTWDCAGSPYIVVNSISVRNGATLNIEPGVEVRFKSDKGLTVGHSTGAGTLVATGTGECPILFTSNAPYEPEPTDPAPGDWVRIYFTDYATDAEYDEFGEYVSGSVLEHVIVEYSGSGGPAITAENSSPYLGHATVRYNAERGILVTSSGAGPVKIEDCEVHHNDAIGNGAIDVNASGGGRSITIERCRIHDHANCRGIEIHGADGFPVTIKDCEIARCTNNATGGGIVADGGTNNEISHNLVENCTATSSGDSQHRWGGGIYLNARTTVTGNIVRNNRVSVTGRWADANGGGIVLDTSCDGSTVSDNVVTGNSVDSSRQYARGGGILLWNAEGCTLQSNIVTGNTADGPGGGIYLFGSGKSTLTGNTVRDNTATTGPYSSGGGIYLEESWGSTLTENVVANNSTTGQDGTGGGIMLNRSGSIEGWPCRLEHNEVKRNRTSGQNAGGGGIRLHDSWTCWLRHNTVSDNVTMGSQADGGGILIVGGGLETLESNTITNNTSGDQGGGILFWNSGRWTLDSNVITDNTAATDAGGVYIGNSGCAETDPYPQCTMTDTVVARNHSSGDTGGIYVYNSPWVSFAGDPETCTYNCICDNDGYCIYNDTPFDPAGSGDIDARYVIWCTDDPQDIDDCIYDFFDNANKGEVIWYPFVPGDCENWDWPAWRDLSAPELAYRPEVPKVISIQISPPDGAETILLEEEPPIGWAVSDISHGGVWEGGKVKWGPFFSPFPTEVHYTVMPPPDADGEACFSGTISIDGGNLGICGDKCNDKWHCPYIPADEPQDYCSGCEGCGCGDATCEDSCVEMCEVGGYACAWKKDCNDDLSGMTRAAYIWKGGECCYCWDEVIENWFLTSCPAPESGCCGDAGDVATLALTGGAATRQFSTQGAERNFPDCYCPGVSFEVTVRIDTPDGLLAMALEDQPPASWTVGSMSDGCEWGPDTGKVKCGPFFAPFPVEVRYTVTPPEDAVGEECFTGTVSFDGINQAVDGDQCVAPYLHDLDDYTCIWIGDSCVPFQGCLMGPDIAYPADSGCEVFDFEFDGNVDLLDFAAFQRSFCP